MASESPVTALAPPSAEKCRLFAKSSLALDTVAAKGVLMSGVFAQNFGYRDRYRFGRRGDYRDMRRDGRDL